MDTKEYVVGRTSLLLPADHALERYQAKWKRYDKALGEIARLVRQKYRPPRPERPNWCQTLLTRPTSK